MCSEKFNLLTYLCKAGAARGTVKWRERIKTKIRKNECQTMLATETEGEKRQDLEG